MRQHYTFTGTLLIDVVPRTHEKHVFGHESGCYARFLHFEKGNRRGIARSSDLDYSQGSKSKNPIFVYIKTPDQPP